MDLAWWIATSPRQLVRDQQIEPRGARHGARSPRCDLVFAPGRRAHSSDGIRAMGGIVSPPPRIVPGGLSQSRDELTELSIGLSQAVQAADRSTTPFGTVPVVTMRHSSIRSFRASATIMVVLRAPFAPSVRAWYHCTSALSFWNKRNLQAS